MRAIFLLVAFAACAPAEPPQAALAQGEATAGETAYVCTMDNEVVVQFVSSRGEVLDMRTTGRACDYEDWCAESEVRSPVYSRGEKMTHREWLRRNAP